MPKLEDRVWCCPHICAECAHSFSLEIFGEDGARDEFFCGLGMTPEEDEILSEEVNNPDYYGLFPEDHKYSEEFMKVMRAEGMETIFDGSRYVDAGDCCNFFESTFVVKE